jgi:hypothetical protein
MSVPLVVLHADDIWQLEVTGHTMRNMLPLAPSIRGEQNSSTKRRDRIENKAEWNLSSNLESSRKMSYILQYNYFISQNTSEIEHLELSWVDCLVKTTVLAKTADVFDILVKMKHLCKQNEPAYPRWFILGIFDVLVKMSKMPKMSFQFY